jgi:hypothetical protein
MFGNEQHGTARSEVLSLHVQLILPSSKVISLWMIVPAMLITMPKASQKTLIDVCCLASVIVGFLSPGTTAAQVLEHKRPTEEVVKRYEKLLAQGALLTPEGWARASKLFEHSTPYPSDSEIQVQSRPGLIGEISLKDDRAQVETKWGDFCGTIDSHLRFKPAPLGGCTLMGEFVSLVLVDSGPTTKKGADRTKTGEWKIEKAPGVRSAGIAAAMRYVERIREQSHDPVIRKNASNTIAALKRLSSGCGNASAC